MIQFKSGDTAYVLVHNNRVEEVKIIQRRGDRYSMKAKDGTGMFLAASRLFRTKEDAMLSIKRVPVSNTRWMTPIRSGYDAIRDNLFYD